MTKWKLSVAVEINRKMVLLQKILIGNLCKTEDEI